MSKDIVAAFDFDGTITTKDTFVPFLYRAFGKSKVFRSFIQLLPSVILMGFALSDRDKIKERLLKSLFQGESVKRFSEQGSRYAKTLTPMFRESALKRIEWHQHQGHRCVMVSASLDIYLNDVAKILGFDDLICSVLSHNNHYFDGTLKGGNCRRIEKVHRLRSVLGDLKNYEIYSYGDSIGDREMIDIADHGFYRPFETVKLTRQIVKTKC